jgi:hypothetical protein
MILAPLKVVAQFGRGLFALTSRRELAPSRG